MKMEESEMMGGLACEGGIADHSITRLPTVSGEKKPRIILTFKIPGLPNKICLGYERHLVCSYLRGSSVARKRVRFLKLRKA